MGYTDEIFHTETIYTNLAIFDFFFHKNNNYIKVY